MRTWILSQDMKWQAVIFSLILTGFIFGLFAVARLITPSFNTPVLISPAIMLPVVAVMLYRRRSTFPLPAQERIPLMLRLNVAGYIVGIVGACLMLTVWEFVVSWLGATISMYGILQFGNAVQAASQNERSETQMVETASKV